LPSLTLPEPETLDVADEPRMPASARFVTVSVGFEARHEQQARLRDGRERGEGLLEGRQEHATNVFS
jgi:hypothetical protein